MSQVCSPHSWYSLGCRRSSTPCCTTSTTLWTWSSFGSTSLGCKLSSKTWYQTPSRLTSWTSTKSSKALTLTTISSWVSCLAISHRIFVDLSADSFVINNHLKIFAWAFYTTLFLLLQALKKKVPPKLRDNANNGFMFSSTISFFMCCLMPFGQTSFIEIQNIKKTLPFKLASVSSSFFMLATLFFFLYSITLIAFRASSHYHNERFLKKYLSLLKPFKPHQSALLYYPIFCWKRFI